MRFWPGVVRGLRKALLLPVDGEALAAAVAAFVGRPGPGVVRAPVVAESEAERRSFR